MGCPIPPCKLKFRDLGACQPITLPCKFGSDPRFRDLPPLHNPRNQIVLLPLFIRGQAEKAGLRKFPHSEVKKFVAAERKPNTDPTAMSTNYWEGFVLPGAIFINRVFRRGGFFAFEIFTAVYEEYFALEGLKRVSVVGVPWNMETMTFVKDQLYPVNGL